MARLRRSIENLPPPVTAPSVWYGAAMAKRTDWIHTLSPADLAEIEVAMRRLSGAEADIARITKAISRCRHWRPSSHGSATR